MPHISVRWCIPSSAFEEAMAFMDDHQETLSFPPWLAETPKPRLTEDPSEVAKDDSVIWFISNEFEVVPRFNRQVYESIPSLTFLDDLTEDQRTSVTWHLPPPDSHPLPPSLEPSLEGKSDIHEVAIVDYLLHSFPTVVDSAVDVAQEMVKRNGGAREFRQRKKKKGKKGKGGPQPKAFALSAGLLGQLSSMHEEGVDWEAPIDGPSKARIKTLAEATSLALTITKAGLSFTPEEAKTLVLSKLK